mmetsp:Transcript_29405/g.71008  ORF Transcript_29405/g.71008 Transcript_29405/m.71008 type:complete len:323 (-) Transcript_29405:305-1273(-)
MKAKQRRGPCAATTASAIFEQRNLFQVQGMFLRVGLLLQNTGGCIALVVRIWRLGYSHGRSLGQYRKGFLEELALLSHQGIAGLAISLHGSLVTQWVQLFASRSRAAGPTLSKRHLLPREHFGIGIEVLLDWQRHYRIEQRKGLVVPLPGTVAAPPRGRRRRADCERIGPHRARALQALVGRTLPLLRTAVRREIQTRGVPSAGQRRRQRIAIASFVASSPLFGKALHRRTPSVPCPQLPQPRPLRHRPLVHRQHNRIHELAHDGERIAPVQFQDGCPNPGELYLCIRSHAIRQSDGRCAPAAENAALSSGIPEQSMPAAES